MHIQRPVERRHSTCPPEISRLIEAARDAPVSLLVACLGGVEEWRFGKTDLFYWVEALDRMDALLGDMVEKYRLRDLQSREMSGEDRDVAKAILRFQKMLVENSSNKSIYNSFDTVDPFVYCMELDLAVEALYLLCFFSSKIHLQRSIKSNMGQIEIETLKVLVEKERRGGREVRSEKAHQEKGEQESGTQPPVAFSYYDERNEKVVRMNLSRAAKKGPGCIPEKALQGMPKLEMRRLSHMLRAVKYAEDSETLGIIRMLAFAVLVYHKHTDLSIDSEFISKDLAEVLELVKSGAWREREAALVMIDALFRMRIRHSALIGAMDAHLHNGMIMAILKQIVDGSLPEHFVVGFFNLLSSFFASAPGALALFSAGIVQYTCRTLRDRYDIGARMKSRLVMCANTFLFTIPAPLPRFLAEDGMGILARELLFSVERILSGSGEEDAYDVMMYVKAIMKITSQLFQNAEAGESMRGFLEGAYPRAIVKILGASDAFHPLVLAYLFSALSDYINAEPANLPFIVEAGIFDGFLAAMDRDIPVSPDFLLEAPNMLEAFFLGQSLRARVAEARTIQKLFRAFRNTEMCDVIISYDVSSNYGVFLEKLVRYYPETAADIREGILATLGDIEEQAGSRPPDLTVVLLENTFRMVSCAIHGQNKAAGLLEDGILEQVVRSVLMVELAVESELFALTMEILKKIFTDHPVGTLSYFFQMLRTELAGTVQSVRAKSTRPEKGTQRAPEWSPGMPEKGESTDAPETTASPDSQNAAPGFRRVMFLLNSLLLAVTKTYVGVAEYCTLESTLDVLRQLNGRVEEMEEEKERQQLNNLFYSLSLGILKHCMPLEGGGNECREEYSRALLFLGSIPLQNIRRAANPHEVSSHLQAVKNYILLDASEKKAAEKHLVSLGIEKVLQEVLSSGIERVAGEETPQSECKGHPALTSAQPTLPTNQSTISSSAPGEKKEETGKREEKRSSPGMQNVCCMLEILGIISGTVSGFLGREQAEKEPAPNAEKENRVREMELCVTECVEMLSSRIRTSEMVSHLIKIVEAVFEVPHKGRAKKEHRKDSGTQQQEALRLRLKNILLSALKETKKQLPDIYVPSEIVRILFGNRETAEQLYAQKMYHLLHIAMVKEKAVFVFVLQKIPEMLVACKRTEDASLLRLLATSLVLADIYEELGGESVIEGDESRHFSLAPLLHEARGLVLQPTSNGEVLEARALLALALSRIEMERSVNLGVTGIRDFLPIIFERIPDVDNRVNLTAILNLLLKRMTESPSSIRDAVSLSLKNKYYGKSRALPARVFWSSLASVVFYAPKSVLEYVRENFVLASPDLVVHKPHQPGPQPDLGRAVTAQGITDATISTISNDIFNKPMRVHTGVECAPFKSVLESSAGAKTCAEGIVRAQALSELLFNLPQLASTLEAREYAHVHFFLEQYLKIKTEKQLNVSAEKTEREEDFFSYWCGYFIIALYNYTTASDLKHHIISELRRRAAAAFSDLFVLSDLLQKILVSRFSKNIFEENISIIKQEQVLETLICRAAQIYPRVQNNTVAVEKLARTLEYLARILSVPEKEAFYEEPRELEDESSNETAEGYMEDFDTDETMDSENTEFETEGDVSSEVGISYSTENSTYSSEENEDLLTDRAYHLPEDNLTEELEVKMEKDTIDFLRGLAIHSTSKRFSDELKSFIWTAGDASPIFLQLFDKCLQRKIGGLRRLESEKETTPDTSLDESTEEYPYEVESEDFASEEDAFLGDENGDVPPMDVEVLNSLPEDVLRDTVSQFYQERIATNTAYRPISTQFLANLRDAVRHVFEEEEASYFESFATQRPARKEKTGEGAKEYFTQIRNAPEIVDSKTASELIRLALICNNRTTVYKTLNNLSGSSKIRAHVVSELIKNLAPTSQSLPLPVGSARNQDGARHGPGLDGFRAGTATKRSLEALSYLCARSEDYVFVFCEHSFLFMEIFRTLTKKTVTETLKLLNILGVCFSSGRVGASTNLAVSSLLKVFEYDLQSDAFSALKGFVASSASAFRSEYLGYIFKRVIEILNGFLRREEDFKSIGAQKESVRLFRMLALLRTLGIPESQVQPLNQISGHAFWRYFFDSVLPAEKGSLAAVSLLPLFEAFITVHQVEVKAEPPTGKEEKPRQKQISMPGIRHSPSASTDYYHEVIEKERDTLNAFISLQPELLFDAFSGLPPRILDFDNKRAFFHKQIETAWQNRPTISLTLDRASLFEDTFHQLMRYSGEEVALSRFNIKFAGEEGVDVGGLTREWYSALSKEMFNLDYALFTPTGAAYHPNPNSSVNPEHLLYFKFIGRVLGKAVHDGTVLDCYFTRGFYKHLLGIPTDISDLEITDPEFQRSLKWMLENDIESVFDLTFSIEVDRFGTTEAVELKEGGKDIQVTNANKKEYVELVCEYKLVRMVERQLAAFSEGFFEVVDPALIGIFDERELELLISGLPEIDVDDWRNNTVYHGYTSNSQVIRWFWRAVRSFSLEERAKLLQFSTGTSKLPLEGFSGLRSPSGIQKFQIHRASGSSDRLPTAHTCFNQLDLPEYESYETLVKYLLFSCEECPSGFGFA